MANYNEYSPEELDMSVDKCEWVTIDYLSEDGNISSIDTSVFFHYQPNTGLAGLPSLSIDVIIPLAAIDYANDPEADILTHYEGSGYEELNMEHEKLISKGAMEFLTNPQIQLMETINQLNTFNKSL